MYNSRIRSPKVKNALLQSTSTCTKHERSFFDFTTEHRVVSRGALYSRRPFAFYEEKKKKKMYTHSSYTSDVCRTSKSSKHPTHAFSVRTCRFYASKYYHVYLHARARVFPLKDDSRSSWTLKSRVTNPLDINNIVINIDYKQHKINR